MVEKIALSASFWKNPGVKFLLHQCSAIYTTQVKNYEALCKEFGEDRIYIIPCSTPSMLNLIKEWYPDYDFITYNELFNIQYNYKD